jgi:hypothetical protein|tara:strand:+ start:733 stop:960 length:228 start_codon:yes stop_codon:yes gene_type:complete
MREKIENFIALIGSIVVGVPLGIVVGLICWFKFPFQIYHQALANLDLQRAERAKEKADIWGKHAQRMEERKNYDN